MIRWFLCFVVAIAAYFSSAENNPQLALYFSLSVVILCADAICTAIKERGKAP